MAERCQAPASQSEAQGNKDNGDPGQATQILAAGAHTIVLIVSEMRKEPRRIQKNSGEFRKIQKNSEEFERI